nr:hypothetical protein [Serinicoccus sp. CNJ-927]
MQLAAAQTGVRCSDGSTNVVALGSADNAGVDLGAAPPAGHPGAGARLLPGLGHAPRAPADPLPRDRCLLPGGPARVGQAAALYVDQAGGDVMDEPATARMLVSAVLRGLHCGALDEAEVRSASGLDRDGLVTLLG